MSRIYNGECGTHMRRTTLSRKIIRQGYFWTTLQMDYNQYVQRCHKCQKYAKAQNLSPRELYSMMSPWPFSIQGIDIIGQIHPKASNEYQYILVAIDYFSKWVESKSYTVWTAKKVAQFIRRNIICRYGVPQEVIFDNGAHFQGEADKVLAEYGIKRHKSSPYRPQTNEAVEAANKNLKNVLSKMVENGKYWHLKLPFALWGYRTTERVSTKMSPFSLVYGAEVVLPVEIEASSLRVRLENQVSETRISTPNSSSLQQERQRKEYQRRGFSIEGHT